jgi:hypothetical protein
MLLNRDFVQKEPNFEIRESFARTAERLKEEFEQQGPIQ